MPLYEYKCLECDKIFEFIHGINDNPPEAVDKCEKKKLFSCKNHICA